MAQKIEYEYGVEDEVKEPNKYRVLLLNDDYSTMEFVVEILINIFRKSQEEATAIMLDIHNKGKAVCGIYTKEIAYTKIAQVKYKSEKAGFPLKAIAKEIR